MKLRGLAPLIGPLVSCRN
ncbi:hypothetical protein AZE42_01070 [Rhizopogon vesiculosus]|uniref:Uncharacterized protein n=1 Tax=Rhizopogon vesiculosus TaxID=180088 RepID=A0A1J8PFF9_9AGAM|nr:hypothetical protein AZE42_01070 [Rhizopogon vesiculosus]